MQAPSFERPTRIWQWGLWHLGAAAALIAIPAQMLLGAALYMLPREKWPFFGAFLLVYAGTTSLIAVLTRGGRRLGSGPLILILVAMLGVWALFLLLTKADYARPLLLLLAAGACAALLLSLLLPRGLQVALGAALLLATLGLQAANERPRALLERALELGPKPARTQGVINTAYYSLQASFYDRYFEICNADRSRCDTPRTGGAIANFAGGLLYATGEGQLHFVATGAGRTLQTQRLATDVPINDAEFVAGGANERDLSVFRVMDILPRERDGRFDLFAAHHHWDTARQCFTMRVSRLAGTTAELLAGKPQADWQTVWDAEPCLPLKMNNGKQKQFGGDGAGGRLLMRGEDTLLVTIGDQQWDGWNYDEAVSQDRGSAYGKLIAIDLATGQGRVLASGLRNPEGFHEDEQGRLWETEHGPQGGDELNLLVEGGNYGWPLATYGNEYGTQDWPLRQPDYDDDPALKRPIYAWLPSIGLSQLTTVKSPLFPRWRGDFLILSLNASLQRAHIEEGRVILVEPIRLRERNGRLRDVEQLPDGRLVFLIDGGAFAFVAPLDAAASDPRTLAARGAMLFSACQQCHRVGDGRDHAIGPDLHAVAGRPIAKAEGYAYSDALRAVDGAWTDERLDAFLRDPQAFAPGTAMQIRGLGEADDRAALIAHLKTLR
ncbi:MAG TPA: PQQ-dependent sugar dehydrogenase [Gammaproteobacteria bacterium]|nr:PQQ-dependent sugar dehydrogenase [Gammaproteobacteria bacterium]